MIKEQTRNVSKILSVDLLLFRVEFKHGNFVITIYFIARGTPHLASQTMTFQLLLFGKEEQTKWTNKQDLALVLFRQWTVIPRFDNLVTKTYELN